MPWLIQKLCDLLRYGEHNTRLTTAITTEEVHDRFYGFISDLDKSRDAAQFVNRITRYYSKDDARLAFKILDWAARDPSEWKNLAEIPPDLRETEQFLVVFHNLIYDHYLISRSQGSQLRWRYDFIRTIYRRQRLLREGES
jgi:hypothetical protein